MGGLGKGVGQGLLKGNKSAEGGAGQDCSHKKKRQRAKYVLVGRTRSLLCAALLHVSLLSQAVTSTWPVRPQRYSIASALLAQEVPEVPPGPWLFICSLRP